MSKELTEQYRYPAIQLPDDHTFMDQMFKVASECQEFIAEIKKYKACVAAGDTAGALEALNLAQFEMCNTEHAIETARRISSQAVAVGERMTVEKNIKRGYYGDVMDLLPTRADFEKFPAGKVEFLPTHKLALVTGHPPKSCDDAGFYRRLLTIPFSKKFGEDVEDAEKIAADRIVPNFPPLHTGENRPVTWQYQLDGVVGSEKETSSVTIFSKQALDLDHSGENGYEKFAVTTLTRAEIAEILKVLDEDIASFKKHCPEGEFE